MFGLFKSQQAFTVHEKPEPPADRDERAERLKFVREGFSLFAFLVPPLWMLVNRMWLVLLGYLVAAAAIYGAIDLFEVDEHWLYYAMLALNFVVGFEADALERWTLDQRGWRMIGSVTGNTYEECERRFFEGWVPTVAIVNPNNFERPGNFSATTTRAEPPREGDVMPPKRSGWRSQGGWLRRKPSTL
jgi:hypothetical protein